MNIKITTDNFTDDELETASTDEVWTAAPTDDEPDEGFDDIEKPLRRQSALRCIEERRELERLRREIEDFDFENSTRIEHD